MREYIEFRLALQEVVAMGYSIGLNFNQKQQDWRVIASYPGVGVAPWVARGETMEKAFMKVHEQLKSGVRDAK